jgi:cytidylate kinase
MDGRDIGSVVFPDAELKLFITASLKERTLRRSAQMKDVSIEEIEQNLSQRDFDDSNREENPLIQAKDAILIDNTKLSKEEQFQLILQHCNKLILS